MGAIQKIKPAPQLSAIIARGYQATNPFGIFEERCWTSLNSEAVKGGSVSQ
jgi:hypothetical protein